MNAFTVIIASSKTSSAIFGGYADSSWVSTFVDSALSQPWVQKVLSAGREIVGSFRRFAERAWNFFQNWFRDDPVGATAGAVAGVLTLGVVIVVGAKVAAFIGGLSLLSKIKLALTAAISLLSVGAVIRHVVRGTQFLWNFNFNITDSQIRQQQEAALTSLYTLAGEVVGYGIGALVCGGATAGGVGLARFNLRAAANVIRVLSTEEDIKDELISRMNALINGTMRAVSTIAFLEIYKNARKWIKAAAQRPEIRGVLPDSWEKVIEAWGKEGSEAWTIAEAIESAIENISDAKIRAFTEAAYESFTDACTETTLTLSTYQL